MPPARIARVKGVSFFYTGGMRGYFEPCGCQARMLGGMDRQGTLFQRYRQVHPKVFSVEAGDSYFEKIQIPSIKRRQVWLKARLIADLYRALNYRVVGVGPADLALGLSTLRKLAARSKARHLASNLVDRKSNKAVFPTRYTLKQRGLKLGFFSLTRSPAPALKAPANFWQKRQLKLTDPVAAAQREIAALRKEGAQVIVLLSSMGLPKLAGVLSQVKGVDFAIDGRDGQELPGPAKIGKSYLLSLPEEGQKLGSLVLYPRQKGLAWRQLQTEEQLQALVKMLQKQAVRYDSQAKQLRAQGAELEPVARVYQTRAGELRQKAQRVWARRSNKPQLIPGKNSFFFALIPITEEIPKYPPLRRRIVRYEKAVREANKRALKKIKVVKRTAKGDFFTGAKRCAECHEAPYKHWRKMRHASAYQTLVKEGKQFDMDCIGCHVVGWQKPGGMYNIYKPGPFAGVQCENCHGYGGLHEKSEGEKLAGTKTKVPEKVCRTCHHGSHDPKFDYKEKLKKILGPDHGAKALARLLGKKAPPARRVKKPARRRKNPPRRSQKPVRRKKPVRRRK